MVQLISLSILVYRLWCKNWGTLAIALHCSAQLHTLQRRGGNANNVILWVCWWITAGEVERTETERCCVWGKIRDVLYRLELDSEYTRTWRKLYETSSGINISPKMTPPVTNIIWQIMCNQPIAQPNPLLKIRIFVGIYWEIFTNSRDCLFSAKFVHL